MHGHEGLDHDGLVGRVGEDGGGGGIEKRENERVKVLWWCIMRS